MHAAKGGSGPRNSTRTTPQPPAWWTDADQAELDTLIHEFVRAAWAHTPPDYDWPNEPFRGCRECWERMAWCPALADAWEALEDWVRGRRLLSRAAYLRAAQKLSELRNRAA